MLLRPYAPTDYDRIMQLFLLNTPTYFHPREQADLEYFLTLEMETDPYYVLEHEGEVLASGGYYFENNKAGLSWFIVHPAHHGRGLGSQLVNHHLAILKKSNVEKIIVDTSQLVYPFYERFGFVLISTKDDHWGPGMHLYSMELP